MSTTSTTNDLARPTPNIDCDQHSSADGLGEAEAINGMDVTVQREESEGVLKPQEIQDNLDNTSREANEDAEAQIPRAARTQSTPSQKQIEEHRRTHCPDRSWCEYCVRGQAVVAPSHENLQNHLLPD